MYNPKRLCPYKHNNLTYLVYNNDCFNNKKCEFKVKIVVKLFKKEGGNTVSES